MADVPETGLHEGSGGAPEIAINPPGMVTLNDAAYRALGVTHVVQLLWDHRKRTLSIQAVWPKIDGSLWIIRHSYPWPRPRIPGGATYTIDATPFFRHHRINHADERHYTPEIHDKTLIIPLSVVEPAGIPPPASPDQRDLGHGFVKNGINKRWLRPSRLRPEGIL